MLPIYRFPLTVLYLGELPTTIITTLQGTMGSSGSDLFFKSVARHFVTLSCLQKRKTGEEKTYVFSGFLIQIREFWFYVTAGHIRRDIKQAITQGDEFKVWRLGDQTAGKQFTGGIPFDFERLATYANLCLL